MIAQPPHHPSNTTQLPIFNQAHQCSQTPYELKFIKQLKQKDIKLISHKKFQPIAQQQINLIMKIKNYEQMQTTEQFNMIFRKVNEDKDRKKFHNRNLYRNKQQARNHQNNNQYIKQSNEANNSFNQHIKINNNAKRQNSQSRTRQTRSLNKVQKSITSMNPTNSLFKQQSYQLLDRNPSTSLFPICSSKVQQKLTLPSLSSHQKGSYIRAPQQNPQKQCQKTIKIALDKLKPLRPQQIKLKYQRKIKQQQKIRAKDKNIQIFYRDQQDQNKRNQCFMDIQQDILHDRYQNDYNHDKDYTHNKGYTNDKGYTHEKNHSHEKDYTYEKDYTREKDHSHEKDYNRQKDYQCHKSRQYHKYDHPKIVKTSIKKEKNQNFNRQANIFRKATNKI